MNNISKIFFWDPCLSPHKIDLMNQIKNDFKNIELILVSPMGFPDDKKYFINKNYVNTNITIIITNNKKKIESLINGQINKDINILSGYWANKNAKLIIKYLQKIDKKFFFISETRFHFRFLDVVKLFQSIVFEKNLRVNTYKIFCIGRYAKPWFKYSLYPKDKLIDFSYYVNIGKINKNYSDENKHNSTLRLGYIGALISEKGIFNYIKALKNFSHDYIFYISGDGVDKNLFLTKCKDENIKFEYLGVTDYDLKYSFFSNIDCLILSPKMKSKRNGWCTVVNESLLFGKPVICNKYVGASVLIDSEINGIVLENDKYSTLLKALNKFAKKINFFRSNNDKIYHDAFEKISVESGSNKIMHYISNE